jgi:hypothetical protein
MAFSPTFAARKRNAARAGKFSASPRAECAAAMPETTDCRAASALLIPLALRISRKRSKAGRSRRVPDPRHRDEFPARQRLHYPARLGFGEDIAFRSPNNQRRTGDAAQHPAAIGAGGSGRTSLGLAGVEAWAPAADLPPLPGSPRRLLPRRILSRRQSGRTGRSRNVASRSYLIPSTASKWYPPVPMLPCPASSRVALAR